MLPGPVTRTRTEEQMNAEPDVSSPAAASVCTVATRRELAQAAVLTSSVREVLGGSMTVLVIDEAGAPLPGVAGARVLGLADVGIDAETAVLLALTRTSTELSASVRPRLLGRLLDEGAGEAIFLEPHTVLHGALDTGLALAGAGSVALVPRLGPDFPLDDLEPTEAQAMRAGAVDTSFVAVRDTPSGRAFLDWWQSRSEAVTWRPGTNVLDLAAVTLDGAVLVRDPGWNLGRWTAAHRELVRTPGGGVLVDGRPLVWTNHDGYSPSEPHLLSAADATRPRTLLSEAPVLQELCDDYRERLLDAGHEEAVTAPVPFSEIDGVRVDARVRRLVSEHLFVQGDPTPVTTSLATWLCEPASSAGRSAGLGPLLMDLLAERPDLQRAFPQTMQGDPDAFMEWADQFAESEANITESTLRRQRELLAARRSREEEPAPVVMKPGAGVEVVGLFTAELGIGQAARMVVNGLEGTGVPVATTTYLGTSSRRETPWTDRTLAKGVDSDFVLVCLNADTLATFAEDDAGRVLRGRYVVGMWFWEVDIFPEAMRPSLDLVDEIWVASEFNREVLAPLTDKPVRVVPLPVHVSDQTTTLPAEMETTEELFTFGFVFDHLSVFERKNPLGLLRAYQRAFPEPEDTRLVIKSINGDKRSAEREALRFAAQDRPDVILIERYLTREELDGLMWGIDCFVSLHRAEGFGLTMAETMGMGKAVVGTDYSGNLTFMDATNSRLVKNTLVPIPPGNPPYPTTAQWARPSVRHAALIMRRLKGNPGLVSKLGQRARETIEQHHSPEAFGAVAAARIEEIRRDHRP